MRITISFGCLLLLSACMWREWKSVIVLVVIPEAWRKRATTFPFSNTVQGFLPSPNTTSNSTPDEKFDLFTRMILYHTLKLWEIIANIINPSSSSFSSLRSLNEREAKKRKWRTINDNYIIHISFQTTALNCLLLFLFFNLVPCIHIFWIENVICDHRSFAVGTCTINNCCRFTRSTKGSCFNPSYL
jgi:hypothetical protein